METEDLESIDDSAPIVTHLGADVLIGVMPTETLRNEILFKLTTKREWKPMRVALTDEAIFLARQDEETLRDRIPLLEIIRVTSMQRDDAGKNDRSAREKNDISMTRFRDVGSNMLSVATLLQQEDANLHILQLQTKTDGYNCGKVYYLNAATEEQRTGWMKSLESAIALAQKRAAPNPMALQQRRLRRVYRNHLFQSIFAVLNHDSKIHIVP